MPTYEQAIASVCVCQSLSDMLQPIFILAGVGEGIEIIIFADGSWEFYEDDKA